MPTSRKTKSSLTGCTSATRCVLHPGETVPVDGEVTDERSAIEKSMVTSESMPMTKDFGAQAIGGGLNQSSELVIEARKVGRDRMLSRIVQLVAEVPRSRAQINDWPATSLPAVITIAALASVAWAFWGPKPRMSIGIGYSTFLRNIASISQ